MDASWMVERCKAAQEHMEPECDDAALLKLLAEEGLRCRGDEISADKWDPSHTSLAPEREVREIRPLDDNEQYPDAECYGV